VDFPFSAFVIGNGTLNFNDIVSIDVIFQSAANLAITGIYAIPTGYDLGAGTPYTPGGPATYTCANPS
jgi:hypothetical protein